MWLSGEHQILSKSETEQPNATLIIFSNAGTVRYGRKYKEVEQIRRTYITYEVGSHLKIGFTHVDVRYSTAPILNFTILRKFHTI